MSAVGFIFRNVVRLKSATLLKYKASLPSYPPHPDVFVKSFEMFSQASQPTLACSKSTIKTLKIVGNMFKVDEKKTPEQRY